MYLKDLYIENIGPLGDLHLSLPFSVEGLPKPVVLVGGNGSGKTTILSIVADALVEAAAQRYDNVTTPLAVGGRNWFRMLGPHTARVGSAGGFALLHFEHEGESFAFTEKSGNISAVDAQGRVPDIFRSAISWKDTGNVKEFRIGRDQ